MFNICKTSRPTQRKNKRHNREGNYRAIIGYEHGRFMNGSIV